MQNCNIMGGWGGGLRATFFSLQLEIVPKWHVQTTFSHPQFHSQLLQPRLQPAAIT